MKRSTKRTAIEQPSNSKLFLFTKKDEAMMAMAIKSSIRFMETYGKGRQPYMVDLSHYRY